MPTGIPQRFSDPTFKPLEAEWNRRLRASGLNDVEYAADLNDGKLRDHWIETSRKAQRGVLSGAAEWFRLAYEWLDIARWPSRQARLTWVAVSEGWTLSDLVRRFPVPVSRVKARALVRAQTELMLNHFMTSRHT